MTEPTQPNTGTTELKKFRQAIFVNGEFSHWHYWGFIEEQVTRFEHLTFVAPEMNLSSIEEAYKNSYQHAGLKNKDGVDIYRGDWVKWEIQRGTFLISEVIFIRGMFCVASGGLLWACGDSCSRDGKLGDIETVGNIIENPEVVEGYVEGVKNNV